MRNAQGWHETTWRDGHKTEADTFTCAHCNRIVVVSPAADPATMGGVCLGCTERHRLGLICAKCEAKHAATGKCEPFERALDVVEQRDRFMRSLGIC